MQAAALIDVWDVASFDGELRCDLDVHADLIRNFMITSARLYAEREASDHLHPYPDNPFAGEFMAVSDHIGRLMAERMIRAWHYTRLTDAEVTLIRRDGIQLSSMDSLQARLAALVAVGTIDEATAGRLYADSPFHSDQRGSRSNKFWLVSHPHAPDDSGVELLLESWGGEVAYFWQRDPDLQALLRRTGRARVLEMAIPMAVAWSSSLAGSAVVATYGRWLGCRYDSKAFDLFIERPLPPEAIRAVHSEGDPTFDRLARGYPVTYCSEFGDETT